MKNTRNMILSGMLVALVVLVAVSIQLTGIATAVPVGTGVNPGSSLTVYTVKKAALLCDNGASAPPSQSPPEIGGCIDISDVDPSLAGNLTDFRANEYLFTGEQLAEIVVARDLSGAQFLGQTANLMIDGQSKVTCSDVTPLYFSGSTYIGDSIFYGHNLASLFALLPPKQGISDSTGFNASFDKVYFCKLTVTPSMVGNPSSVTVEVSDVTGATAQTDVQKWYFNPAISISVSFDSGTSIQFPAAQAGQTVYSTNTLMIKNTAAGGVDLAVYLTGNDLTDTSGIGLCPSTNVLNVNNIAYRCKVGTFMSEVYTPLPHIKQANTCRDLSERQCLVEDSWPQHNDLLPDATSAYTSILYNGHTAECWFQLNVPTPCIGTFSAANAVDVLVRAI